MHLSQNRKNGELLWTRWWNFGLHKMWVLIYIYIYMCVCVCVCVFVHVCVCVCVFVHVCVCVCVCTHTTISNALRSIVTCVSQYLPTGEKHGRHKRQYKLCSVSTVVYTAYLQTAAPCVRVGTLTYKVATTANVFADVSTFKTRIFSEIGTSKRLSKGCNI